MFRKPVSVLALVLSVACLVQTIGYFVWSREAMIGTITPFLPSSSRCQIVCMDTSTALTHRQHRVLKDLLRARYKEVYESLEDVPDATWSNDSPEICEIEWRRTASGAFLLNSSYSASRSGTKTGVEETYAWVLFRWVRLRQRLFVETCQVVV